MPLDENTRRYYLDAMGIQCWQEIAGEQVVLDGEVAPSLDGEQIDSSVDVSTGNNKEVVTWDKLETSIKHCELCALHKTRNQSVINISGSKKQPSALMFVLLAPDNNGVLLSEQAKSLFEKMLAAINISIHDVAITSLLKCSVPENHTVLEQEIVACNNHLKQQIQLVNPKQLIVLGDVASHCLLQKKLAFDDLRLNCNQAQSMVNGVPLFVSYSPEELLLNPEHKRKAWADLQQIQKEIGC